MRAEDLESASSRLGHAIPPADAVPPSSRQALQRDIFLHDRPDEIPRTLTAFDSPFPETKPVAAVRQRPEGDDERARHFAGDSIDFPTRFQRVDDFLITDPEREFMERRRILPADR